MTTFNVLLRIGLWIILFWLPLVMIAFELVGMRRWFLAFRKWRAWGYSYSFFQVVRDFALMFWGILWIGIYLALNYLMVGVDVGLLLEIYALTAFLAFGARFNALQVRVERLEQGSREGGE